MQKKSAIYIRVSTLHQIDKDSLPMQREDLINYSRYVLNISDYEIFEDAGYSGKNTDRPAYQDMMNRIRAGEFSHIMVWKIDRISRNLLDFATMYEEIKKLAVVFISKNEQFDTSTAMGEAMLKIILVFAELERRMTSERVTATMLSRAEKGIWNGGKIPFGYIREDNEFKINADEASTIRYIYNQYEQNQSLVHVSKYLNGLNIKTRNKKDWSPTTLQIILRNPFYTGVYRYNYLKGSVRQNIKKDNEWIVIEDHHPAIITKEQYQHCIDILTDNNRKKLVTRHNKYVHIFAGLLKCYCCGSNMNASIDKERANGYRPSLYICAKKRIYNTCDNIYVNDITIGSFVLQYVSNMIKLQKEFTASTSITDIKETLTSTLSIHHIKQTSLDALYDLLQSAIPGTTQYNKVRERSMIEKEKNETIHFSLIKEKEKNERALERLQKLYLYEDDAMSEKAYLLSKRKIENDLEAIKINLKELTKQSIFNYDISDEDLINKASAFLLAQKINDEKEACFKDAITSTDKNALKDFINSIVENIFVYRGKVMSIKFKNNINHEFIYEKSPES